MSTTPIGGSGPLPLPTTDLADPTSQGVATGRPAAAGAPVHLLDAAGVDPRTLGMLHGDDHTAGVPPPADGAAAVSPDTVHGMQRAIVGAEASVQTDIYAFMAMFAKIQQGMRDNARAEQTAELQAQVGSLRAAAGEIVKAADERLAGAIVEGVTQMAGSALTIAVSVGGAARMMKTTRTVELDGADNFASSRSPSFNFSEGSIDMAKFNAANRLSEAVGKLGEGGAHMAGGAFEHAAGEADAQGKQDEAEGVQAEAHRSHAEDLMRTTGETLHDLRDKLSAMEQSNEESLRGMARNI